jgi:hypothetical protein
MLVGQEKKIFVLDFFGSEKLLNSKPSFQIPPHRLLTAFGSPWNTFLGYYLNDTILYKYNTPNTGVGVGKSSSVGIDKDPHKLSQGVIWGKDPKHYNERENLLQTLSREVQLHSTATRQVIPQSKIIWHGHQTVDSWMTLLRQSKFLLGLGDPLLGPSAIDAISMGCVYINPIYRSPTRQIRRTQHDYATTVIGEPYVCDAHLENIDEVRRCIDYALKVNLQPFIPHDFRYEEYLTRVRRIFLEGD